MSAASESQIQRQVKSFKPAVGYFLEGKLTFEISLNTDRVSRRKKKREDSEINSG
jgi:hypothetical protein